MNSKEIIFIVEESDEGGYIAKALSESIFTEAEDISSLKKEIVDAVHCHFEGDKKPDIIKLHYVKEEYLAV